MTNFRYRVTVNGTQSKIATTPPANWTQIADQIETRGGCATLERQLVTDHDLDFIAGLTSTVGFVFLPKQNMILCDWEIFAEIKA